MHKKFDSTAIEKKWQAKWKDSGLYDVEKRDLGKAKEYVLVEWPYPSGNLHIGHWYAFGVPDIYVRYQRMIGKQVLFPMGFDAFGLPAENAAIKRKLDPKQWTNDNIAYMKEQLASMGNAFTWNKSTSSTDKEYYQWTQWMFTKFFEKDIAYRGKGIVNWCPGCNTVIANEQVLNDGTCERSGDVIEKKEMPQWMLRITKYADRLVDDLDALDWPEPIKEAQRQWINRSSGAEIDFLLNFKRNPADNENRGPNGEQAQLTVFTTRPDTLFGATYLVLAPEHPWVTLALDEKHNVLNNKQEVLAYVQDAKKKSEIERTAKTKEKTGVKLDGVVAINPANNEEIPIFVADYVLSGYGTGAIMAVPAHDERDFAFAQKFNVPIKQVITTCRDDSNNPPEEGLKEVERETVVVHLRDKSTGKFALLHWHGPLEGIRTAIMGGVEPGQTPEEAALAEIMEESGIPDAAIIHKARWITAARYSARHKGVNRCAVTHSFLAEVDSLKNQGEIPDSEQAIHTLTWEDEKQMMSLMTPEHQKQIWSILRVEEALLGDGFLANSDEFNGMDSEKAKEAITKKVGGRMTNTYRLRDWSIGRQRYWGVPIPIVYDPEGNAHPIPEQHLPWLLPEDVDPTPTGVAPLAKSAELKKRTEEIFGQGWTPEVETMDTFVDSSWYYLRYLDNENDTELASLQKQKDWMPIDIYFGGAEHTTMHLLYSRFWQKALFDLGLVTDTEPYKRRINRGLILGPDGNKMSKSKGNVIDPDEQVRLVGADTVKMYLAFMGPYEGSNYPWDMGGIAGLRRFLERVYGLKDLVSETTKEATTRQLHKTIKKVSNDITEFKFNTAISAMMIFVNEAERNGLSQIDFETFLKLLAPFAPHLAEELWSQQGNKTSIHLEPFPEFDESLVLDETVTIGVQINGKVRGAITVPVDIAETDAITIAQKSENIAKYLNGQAIKKIIYVPNRILNFIV